VTQLDTFSRARGNYDLVVTLFVALLLISNVAATKLIAFGPEWSPFGLPVLPVITDGGALPLAYSRVVAALSQAGWLTGTITAGQAWGGDIEAVSVHNALLAARHVLHADAAIGTTALRALEASGGVAGSGETDLFITPGYRFQVADGLITNFHLPKSTLLMLVSAFSGIEHIRAAYRHAIEQQYRFFSYGDAMLLTRAEAT